VNEADANPMGEAAGERCGWLAHAPPRCRTTSKASGERCRCPAVAGRPTCRAHGGKGGAPAGERNGAWRHGGRSAARAAAKRERRELLRVARRLLGRL
jgi:hypothetical protein